MKSCVPTGSARPLCPHSGDAATPKETGAPGSLPLGLRGCRRKTSAGHSREPRRSFGRHTGRLFFNQAAVFDRYVIGTGGGFIARRHGYRAAGDGNLLYRLKAVIARGDGDGAAVDM